MFLSIIIAAKNWNCLLEKTISSILSQTIDDFEVIIQLKEDTVFKSLEKSYPDGLISVYCEDDTGIYDALNKGINKAKGEFILFLGQGDYLANNLVVEFFKKFSLNGNDAFCGQVFYYIGEDTVVKKFKLKERMLIKRDLKGGNPVHTQGLFLKREVYQFYLYNIEYCFLADFELLLRSNIWKKIIFVPYPTVMFELGGVSTNINNALNTRKEAIHILLKNNIIPSIRLCSAYLYYSVLSAIKKIR